MTTKKHAFYGILALVSLLGLGITQSAKATELITNGDFETGTFAGWTVVDQAGGSGSFFISTPGAATPISGFPTAANGSGGLWYAVSDQTGPGCHVLLQSFTIPVGASSVSLTFQMFVNNQFGPPIVNPAGLDYTASPNEHARVDILSSSATPFDTGAGVVANLYIGSDAGPTPNPYITYSFDLSSLAAGTYQLRFAEVDNQFFFQQGVDNVSITAEGGRVPDSGSTVVLLGVAMTVVGLLHRRIKAATNRA
jgi:VPDSG-CTERM motif